MADTTHARNDSPMMLYVLAAIAVLGTVVAVAAMGLGGFILWNVVLTAVMIVLLVAVSLS